MGQVRNGFGEVRVLPTLDYSGVEPDRVLEIPDEDVYHWVAGGWTPLTRYPVPHRLYPNHAGDELAYPLPEPDEQDPSAIAVGTTQDELDEHQGDTPAPAPAAVAAQPSAAAPPAPPAPQIPAAAAPAAAPETAPAATAPAAAETKEQQA